MLLNSVRIDAAPLHSSCTDIVETRLLHPRNQDIGYSKNRVVQKRMPVSRETVARMMLQNGSLCIITIFGVQVASAFIRHGAASSCLKRG